MLIEEVHAAPIYEAFGDSQYSQSYNCSRDF